MKNSYVLSQHRLLMHCLSGHGIKHKRFIINAILDVVFRKFINSSEQLMQL